MDIASNRRAEGDQAVMYFVKSQPWLPHYTRKGIYVAPGGIERTEEELISMGAYRKVTVLWSRLWQKR